MLHLQEYDFTFTYRRVSQHTVPDFYHILAGRQNRWTGAILCFLAVTVPWIMLRIIDASTFCCFLLCYLDRDTDFFKVQLRHGFYAKQWKRKYWAMDEVLQQNGFDFKISMPSSVSSPCRCMSRKSVWYLCDRGSHFHVFIAFDCALKCYKVCDFHVPRGW